MCASHVQIPDSARMQYYQWKKAISHVNMSKYDIVIRTRLDVIVLKPETLVDDILMACNVRRRNASHE